MSSPLITAPSFSPLALQTEAHTRVFMHARMHASTFMCIFCFSSQFSWRPLGPLSFVQWPVISMGCLPVPVCPWQMEAWPQQEPGLIHPCVSNTKSVTSPQKLLRTCLLNGWIFDLTHINPILWPNGRCQHPDSALDRLTASPWRRHWEAVCRSTDRANRRRPQSSFYSILVLRNTLRFQNWLA